MSVKCKLGFHEWDGCKCSKCAKARDRNHTWSGDGVTCAKCGNLCTGSPGEPVTITGRYECIPCRKKADAGMNANLDRLLRSGSTDYSGLVGGTGRILVEITTCRFSARRETFLQCSKHLSSTKWKLVQGPDSSR